MDLQLVCHHLKLFVASNLSKSVWTPRYWIGTNLHLEVGGPHPHHAARPVPGDVGEPLNDESGARHLPQPVIVTAFRPVLVILAVCDGEHANLVAFSEKKYPR